MRSLVATAVQKSFQLYQMDVTIAFLNGALEEEVSMRQPEGFEVKGREHLVCKVNRSLYGLKQSPRCWNSTLVGFFEESCLCPVNKRPLLGYGGEMMVGDDIIVAGKSKKLVDDFKRTLGERFNIQDLGKLHYFLGMKMMTAREMCG